MVRKREPLLSSSPFLSKSVDLAETKLEEDPIMTIAIPIMEKSKEGILVCKELERGGFMTMIVLEIDFRLLVAIVYE